MRYGKLVLSTSYLEELLCISTDKLVKNERRITELPDDAHIIGVEFDSVRQVLNILIAGSGAELVKVEEGVTIPIIAFAMETLHE